MILTVTLNAAIDKTLVVPGFVPGQSHRPTQSLALAGGKGNNVARVLHALGEDVLATGIVAGVTGSCIRQLLDAEGLRHAFEVQPTGESRTCIAILDPRGGSHSEIYEAGLQVTPACFRAFKARYQAQLPQASWVALSGSLPPGLDAEAYLELIALAKAAGVGVSLDTSGPEFTAALAGAPDLCKPNQQEAEAFFGGPVELEHVPEAIRWMQKLGSRTVALTLGKLGAAIATPDEAWFVTAPDIDVVNPIGSGDSFLAAWLHRIRRGDPVSEAARWAVAAGSANAAVVGAAACTRADIEALLPATRAVPLADVVQA